MHLLNQMAVWTFLICVMPLAVGGARAAEPETLTAIAAVKSAGGVSSNVPLTIVVRRYATDAERDELLEAVRKGRTPAARAILEKRDDAGTVQFGAQQVAIKHAYSRPTGEGRLITVITAEPILFLDTGPADARARTQANASFDLGLVLLEVVQGRPGRGELLSATKVRVTEQDAIVTDDYVAQTFQLSGVAVR